MHDIMYVLIVSQSKAGRHAGDYPAAIKARDNEEAAAGQ